MPNDYLHLLNCKAEISNSFKTNKCTPNYIPKKIVQCSRLTADLDAGVMNNYYMRPSNKKVYYYIVNRNDSINNPTNKKMDQLIESGSYRSNDMKDNNSLNDTTLKEQYDRTCNQSPVFIEIHAGSQTEVHKIQVAYVKAPMYVSMTEDQIYTIEDNTQVLEFPDYVCYEIINTFVKLVLENASDPRLQTNIPVNQTIAIPGNK